jgi:hypothetical protein
MYYLVLLIVVILIVLYYFVIYKKNKRIVLPPISEREKKEILADPSEEKLPDQEEFIANNWQGLMANSNLDPSIIQSHNKYTQNTRQYSSGANFSAISDDNVSPMQTNFLGFSRPRYVEVDPTARQVPDYDEHTLKRNKRMTFVSDL